MYNLNLLIKYKTVFLLFQFYLDSVRKVGESSKSEDGIQPCVLHPGVEGKEEEEAGQGEQQPAQQHQPARHTLHHRIHCKKEAKRIHCKLRTESSPVSSTLGLRGRRRRRLARESRSQHSSTSLLDIPCTT
jgi:hypothetical protein